LDSWSSAPAGRRRKKGFKVNARQIHEASGRVKSKADSLRLEVHLAKGEAKGALAELQVRVKRVDAKIEALKSTLGTEAHDTLVRIPKFCGELGRELENRGES
jgi:hypothetical protein